MPVSSSRRLTSPGVGFRVWFDLASEGAADVVVVALEFAEGVEPLKLEAGVGLVAGVALLAPGGEGDEAVAGEALFVSVE